VVGDVAELVEMRSETPRRVCSSYRKASISSEVARILLRGE
jgi:hypothetical protein